MSAFIRLIRPANLAMILFTQYMVRFAFMKPIFKAFGFSLQLNEGVFFIFSLAFVLMAAGGYIINDYCDVDIDKINRPDSVVVGKQISKKDTLRLYWLLSLTGLVMGIGASYMAGLPVMGVIFFIYLSGLWYYSSTLKYVFLLGNLIIALFIGLVPFAAGLIELYADVKNAMFSNSEIDFMFLLYWISGISIFAFLSTLAREIVKDMEDIEGDVKSGCKTIPVILGINDTKRVVQFLLFLIFFLLGFVEYQQVKVHDWISLVYFVIAIQLPVLYVVRKIWKAVTPKDFHKVSTALKLVMVSGISYLFVFAYNCMH